MNKQKDKMERLHFDADLMHDIEMGFMPSILEEATDTTTEYVKASLLAAAQEENRRLKKSFDAFLFEVEDIACELGHTVPCKKKEERDCERYCMEQRRFSEAIDIAREALKEPQ